MTVVGWLQIAVILAVVLLAAAPLGALDLGAVGLHPVRRRRAGCQRDRRDGANADAEEPSPS